MIRYVVKVCIAFAVGGVIGVLGLMLFIPFATFSYGIGGGISGASLGRGRKPAIGFALGFVFLGFIVPLMMMVFKAPGSASLNESVWVIIAWFFMYAIAGGIGAAVSGLGWRMALASTAAFGAAGSIAGAAIMISLGISGRGLILLGALVIPHALGGALLAVALEYPSHKRKKLGLCLKCGYDLRASPERCPKCGEPIAFISSQSNA